MKPGDVVGLNTTTGRVRKYRKGDPLVGVVSEKPAFAAGAPSSIAEEMEAAALADPETPPPTSTATHTLVALIGQVSVDPEQVTVNKREVLTTLDRQRVGFRLANGLVFITALGLMSVPGN